MTTGGKLASLLVGAFLVGGAGGGAVGRSLHRQASPALTLSQQEQATLAKILPAAPAHLHVTDTVPKYRLEDSSHGDVVIEVTGVDDRGPITYMLVVTTDKTDGSTRFGADPFQG